VQKIPDAEAKLMTLQGERSDGMLHAIRLLKDMKEFALKRLTTTVEEDKSVHDHFEDVKMREEKAVSEKQQLQQRLKLERLQCQKQLGLMQQQHGAAEVQLHGMKSSHSSTMQNMQKEAEQADAQSFGVFNAYESQSPISLERICGVPQKL
jgi:IQ domain-containing protein D